MMDSDRGTRQMQTFKKLPMQAPMQNIINKINILVMVYLDDHVYGGHPRNAGRAAFNNRR